MIIVLVLVLLRPTLIVVILIIVITADLIAEVSIIHHAAHRRRCSTTSNPTSLRLLCIHDKGWSLQLTLKHIKHGWRPPTTIDGSPSAKHPMLMRVYLIQHCV